MFFLCPYAQAIWLFSPCDYTPNPIGFSSFILWWNTLWDRFKSELDDSLLFTLITLTFSICGKKWIKVFLIWYNLTLLLCHNVFPLISGSYNRVDFLLISFILNHLGPFLSLLRAFFLRKTSSSIVIWYREISFLPVAIALVNSDGKKKLYIELLYKFDVHLL